MSHQILDDANGNILFHQSGGEGVPKCMDIDPLQFTALANCLDPFLVGSGVGVGSPFRRKDEVLGIWLSIVKLYLPLEHEQLPDILIDRRFPVAGFALGGLLEDQLRFLAGRVVKKLNPFQVLVDANGPLFCIEVAPLQR